MSDASTQMPVALFVGAHAEYMYKFRLPVMRRLEARGYRIIVTAASLKGFDSAVFRKAGIEFVEWPVQPAGLNPIADLSKLGMLHALMRRTRPRLLFAHTIKPVIYALLLGRLAGVPRRVVMIPGLGFAFTGGGTLKRRAAALAGRLGYRFALAQASLVILQNEDDRAALTDAGALPRKVPSAVVSGSGVDMAHFSPAPLPPGPPVFLMVARLLRDKGVVEFAEAARHVKSVLPDVRFVLVGGDDYNPAAVSSELVQQWVAEGIIEARGHVEDPAAEYASCHIFVLPSYREGTPRTNLEAMARARAIITTDVPGCRETVEHGVNGLLVPAQDAAALAEAMLELARDPERVAAMGAAGFQRCLARYELGKVADRTATLIVGESADARDLNPNPGFASAPTHPSQQF